MKSKETRIVQLISHIFCGLIALCALLPFVLMIISSVTDEAWATSKGYSFFPGKFSLEAYRYIGVQWDTIGKAYLMTLLVTAIGTTVSVIITTLFAYGISQKNVPGMKFISFMLIFTMLFNGGLVSTYYTYVQYLDIKDTIWALIVPSLLMNAFNVILVRNYISFSIPGALKEAATIDGASEFRIFASIIIPLSLPIVATIGLMTALSYWNDWQNGMYYLSGRGGNHLYTIQIFLNNINENIQVLMQNASKASALGAKVSELPSTTIRMAIAAIGILPILIMYPFFQRYFVKGITLGGVKE
ncbi:sugar ABC transporter permease [Paenibacillus sp. FSL P4-0081]|uniref:carbohydrate ABC transporter permease n=1 Tax=unclassified Paenibacillus TaxID=185978 RepID=UPI0004F7F4B8|nr:carbohydrate ABC transporter permease [Paenibacillus sp. FSL P4-0081]AIQ31537.1 sugar ABC transporter permease [Paenibacillus sp. FSL P4-0081]